MWKHNKTIQKMINVDDVVKESITKLIQIRHKLLIIHTSFKLINQQPDIGNICLYAKDPHEGKYQFLINKRESTGLKLFNDSKAFIEYLNDLDDIYKNIEENYPNKKRKILIVFDYMIADMPSNKKPNPIVLQLFIKGRKLNISLAFTT